MDIKSLWQKLDQIAEASDVKSIPETKKKKPDADGDGVPDWADKKPGEDDNEDKKKVEESQSSTKAEHDRGYADAQRGVSKNPYNPGSPSASAYDQGQEAHKRHFGEGLGEGEMSSRKGDSGETIRVHKAKAGGYGRKIDKDDESGDAFHSSDIDDTDAPAAPASVKRGRGRPMKGGDSETGITKKYDTDTLASWIIGNKPKNIGKIGKVSHVNRLKEYMEMVERKTIVEGIVAEGGGNKLEQIVDDIIEGRLDIYDIISGKFTPTNKVEEFVQKALTQSYEETARDHGLHADDDGDEIIGIMYNDIHDIMGKAYSKGIDEQAQAPGMPGTAPPAGTQQQQQLPILAQGKQVGMASSPQTVQAATPMVNDIINKKQALGKMGVTVTGLEESLSDTMNRFSSILNESSDRRTLSESKTPKLVLEGTLEEIIAVHPHEHKMCQEGWGMDESLYEALCDHYYKEGRIPRKVWHGSADDLRKCVEECYLQDTQPLMSEDTSMGIIPEELSVESVEEPVESEEKNIRRHAMSNLIDELDETLEDDGGLADAHKKAQQISGEHGVVQHIERDPETGHHRVSDWYDSDTTVATYNNGKLREDMSEAKKPSAGMTKGAKSALVKKAKAGKDIGKPGKGFEKIAKKAGEKYGSAEKGKKVAAAAMWKNAAPTNEGRSEEEWDDQSRRHDGRAARDNPEAHVALTKQGKASRDAAKELAKLRDTQRDLEEGQLNEKFGKEAKVNPAKKGMFKGKTKAELEKQLANLKKTGPHKLGSPENTKMKELQFAIRAKSDWGPVSEGKFSTMDADLADMTPKEFKEEYGMTKAEARAKHGGKKPETKKIEEMDSQGYRGSRDSAEDDAGKPQYTAKSIKAKKMAKDAEKEMNKAFDKSSKKNKVEESVEFSSWDNQLSSLLKPTVKQPVSESAKIKKQMINESSNELSTMLQFAGLKNVQSIMEEFNASIYSNDGESSDPTEGSDNPPQLAMPTGMGMSQQSEDDESTVVEPLMSDEVIGGLSSGDKESTQSDNDHLSFFKKMLSHGQSEVKTDKPKTESGEQSGIPASTSKSPVSGETSEKSVTEDQWTSAGGGQTSGGAATGNPKMGIKNTTNPLTVIQGLSPQSTTTSTPKTSTVRTDQQTKSIEKDAAEKHDAANPNWRDNFSSSTPSTTSSTQQASDMTDFKAQTGVGEPGMTPADTTSVGSKYDAQDMADFKAQTGVGEPGMTPANAGSTTSSMSGLDNPEINGPNGTGGPLEEEDMEEGNEFTAALARARADGIQRGETMKVGGKTYPVKEESTVSGNGDNEEEQAEVSSDAQRDAGLAQGDANFFSSENSSTMAECDDQDMASDSVIGDILAKLTQMMSQEQSQPSMSTDEPVVVDIQGYADEEPQDEQHCDQCQSCGQTMNEGHQCMESLNEWANSPTGESADEQFQTDMEFMTKVISGGLNNQKQDQTTLPSTRVVTKDESKEVDNTMGAMLRKLSGIN